MPWRLTRPWLGRRPTVPQKCAGMRTDPPVSVPSEAKTCRAATAAAEAPEDPPGGGGGGGNTRRIPRIAAIAMVPVMAGRAGGEFRGAEGADLDRPGGVQPGENGRRALRDPVVEQDAAGGRDAAGPVEQVLVGDGDAVQRTAGFAARPARIRRRRGGERALGVDGQEGVENGLLPLDPVEAGRGQFAGRNAAGPEQRRRCGQRQIGRVSGYVSGHVWSRGLRPGSRPGGADQPALQVHAGLDGPDRPARSPPGPRRSAPVPHRSSAGRARRCRARRVPPPDLALSCLSCVDPERRCNRRNIDLAPAISQGSRARWNPGPESWGSVLGATTVGRGRVKGQEARVKAIRFDRFGGPEELKLVEMPDPEPGPDDVLIEVHAVSVVPGDWKLRKGLLTGMFPVRPPKVPGRDGAGIVRAMGENVTGFAVGDRVCFTCQHVDQGSYAQLAARPAADVVPMPENLSFIEGAAVMHAGVCAWIAVVETAGVKAGDRVLVHGAAGAIGGMAVQLCRHLGAGVTGTCSERNRGHVAALGCDRIVPYDKVAFETAVSGQDVVIDLVGGEVHTRSYGVLRPGGMLVWLIAEPFDDRPAGLDISRSARP